MSKWDELSMAEKAEMMKVAVRQGITNLSDIKQRYNEFAEGGSKEGEEEGITDEQYLNTMEKVAEENYKNWGYNNSDEALVHALNDNTYDYRGYYNKYPQSRANADTHWTDEFKTVYHPTFSNESIYSGQKSQYNPYGLPGGFWVGEDENASFIPMAWQAINNQYKSGGGIHIKPSHRGRLTELKKRTGKTEAELYNDGNPAHKKMVVFARNSRKWHGEGGNLFDGGGSTQSSSDYRYIQNEDGQWSRVTNDDMGRVFQGLTVTPNRTKIKYVPERIDNSEQGIKQRDNFFLNRDEDGNLISEPGLRAVSPEFDLLAFGPLFKGLGTTALNGIKKATTFSPTLEQELARDVIKVAKSTGKNKITPIPKDKVEAGYQRMRDFISSPEYQQRLEDAGLGGYKDYMINLVDKRLKKGDFPAKEADVIARKESTKGISEMNPKSKYYGVTIKRNLDDNNFLNVFDHELAHWTSKNTQTGIWNDIARIVPDFKFPNLKLQKIMKYNDEIAPIRSWEEIRNLRIPRLSEAKPGEIENLWKKFLYRKNGQERRSMAYAMTQEAKRRGITTDELVDMYAVDGDIMGEAPIQLQDLGVVYSPKNLKKYLNGFLSTATPLTLGLKDFDYDSRR